MKVAILGTTGYTGMILLRELSQHPGVEQIISVSSSHAGESALSADPGLHESVMQKLRITNGNLVTIDEAAKTKPDVVFACLPHLKSALLCEPFFGSSVVIDLSADMRLDSRENFLIAYKEEPPRPDLLGKAVYGLSEVYRAKIKTSDIIANPGCYPTATLLPIIPFAASAVIASDIISNAISGVSGAGKKATINLLYCERSENAGPYNPGRTHRHYTEIAEKLHSVDPKLNLFFTPHLSPQKRGMEVTTTFETNKVFSKEEILKILTDYYKDCPFIKIKSDGLPETRDVLCSNRCDIAVHIEGKRVFVFSVIDNLVKGASGQAIQNMNIRFGFTETAGLRMHGEI